jgi:hypothetical protein
LSPRFSNSSMSSSKDFASSAIIYYFGIQGDELLKSFRLSRTSWSDREASVFDVVR